MRIRSVQLILASLLGWMVSAGTGMAQVVPVKLAEAVGNHNPASIEVASPAWKAKRSSVGDQQDIDPASAVCPRCAGPCRLVRDVQVKSQTVFDVKTDWICIPRVRLPWQHKTPPPKQRAVRVLTEQERECLVCDFRWEATKAPHGPLHASRGQLSRVESTQWGTSSETKLSTVPTSSRRHYSAAKKPQPAQRLIQAPVVLSAYTSEVTTVPPQRYRLSDKLPAIQGGKPATRHDVAQVRPRTRRDAETPSVDADSKFSRQHSSRRTIRERR